MALFGILVSQLSKHILKCEWEMVLTALLHLRTLQAADVASRPSWIVQALLISGEDHRFFGHCGIDPIAVCRAIWRGVVLGHREGASTIEMQLVRVVTGRFERTLTRKLREAAL